MFEGTYHLGKKKTGNYKWGDGSEYTGTFVNNKMTGSGRTKWLDNKLHGKDILSSFHLLK